MHLPTKTLQRVSVNTSNDLISTNARNAATSTTRGNIGTNVTWGTGGNNVLPGISLYYTVSVSTFGATSSDLGSELVANLTFTQVQILKGLNLRDVQLAVRNATVGQTYRVSLALNASSLASAKAAVAAFQARGGKAITFPSRTGRLVEVQAIGSSRANITIGLNASVLVPFQTRGAADTTDIAASRAGVAINGGGAPACGGWCNATLLNLVDFTVVVPALVNSGPITPMPPLPPSPPPFPTPVAVPVAVPALLDEGRTAGIAIGAACIVLGLVAVVALFIRLRFKARPAPRAPVNSIALVAKDEEYGEEDYGEEEARWEALAPPVPVRPSLRRTRESSRGTRESVAVPSRLTERGSSSAAAAYCTGGRGGG